MKSTAEKFPIRQVIQAEERSDHVGQEDQLYDVGDVVLSYGRYIDVQPYRISTWYWQNGYYYYMVQTLDKTVGGGLETLRTKDILGKVR